MKRLTRKSSNTDMVWFIDHNHNDLNLEPCEMTSGDSGKAIRKLAAYEDTGLTPQEIEQMKARMPLHQWAGESVDKISIFGVPVKKIIEWAEAEKNNRIVLNDIANQVEDKMTYMCGCRNCIEKVKMIIKGEIKSIESQCKYCKIECDARST